MKIAYISNILTIHDYRGLNKLVEKGYETTYITFNQNPIPDYIRGLKPLGIYQPKLPDISENKTGFFNQLQCKIRNFFFVTRELKRILSLVDPDVVHTGYVQQEGFWTILVTSRPTLMVVQGSDILLHTNSLIGKWRARYVLKRSDWVAIDCQYIANKVYQIFPYPNERVSIFPWGIDLNLFNPAKGKGTVRTELGWEENTVVISTRTLAPIYSVETLLQTVPLVIAKCPHVRFLIAGDGPERAKLEIMARKLKITEVIRLLGVVPNERLAMYLNTSDIYVSTSLSDGTSLSLLEAMACKLPVILTDLPQNREWITEGSGGYLFPVKDSSKLAELLIELVEKKSLQVKMGERNSERVNKYGDWDKNFLILEEIYKNISWKHN